MRGGEAVVRSLKKLGVRLSAPADSSGAWGPDEVKARIPVLCLENT